MILLELIPKQCLTNSVFDWLSAKLSRYSGLRRAFCFCLVITSSVYSLSTYRKAQVKNNWNKLSGFILVVNDLPQTAKMSDLFM